MTRTKTVRAQRGSTLMPIRQLLTDIDIHQGKATILVVDDDPMMRELVSVGLKDSFEILTASNYHEAKHVLSDEVDAIVLDYRLGDDTDGLLAIQHIRASEQFSHIPILMISGDSKVDLGWLAHKYGAMDFLGKPIGLAELRAKLENHTRTYRKIKWLLALAQTDELTGVLSRLSFLAAARREFVRSRRFGYSLCALYIDLDRFKDINDNHGHDAGDRVLVDFASRVKKRLREYDFFGRLGGDEFAVLLPNTPLLRSQNIADDILQAIQGVTFGGETLTASVGASELHADDVDIEALINRSDQLSLRGKKQGRNQIVAEPCCDG